MLTIWDFLFLALIALAVVVAVTHAINEAVKKLTPSKEVALDCTLDAMMARMAATGWHFALEGDRYRIWHANEFAGIRREVVTSTAHNDVALWLHAIGCLGRDETFAGCKPRYVPVDMHDDFSKPVDRVKSRAEWLYLGWNKGYALTDYDMRSVVFDVLVRGEVDHPAFFALRSLARAFVSGRAMSDAEVAALIAALDPEKLAANGRVV
jgi:hypothetical protein